MKFGNETWGWYWALTAGFYLGSCRRLTSPPRPDFGIFHLIRHLPVQDIAQKSFTHAPFVTFARALAISKSSSLVFLTRNLTSIPHSLLSADLPF